LGPGKLGPFFMSKRILDYDPNTGITEFFEYDSLTDTTTLSRHQDVEPLLEYNKILQNDAEYSKSGIKNDFWKYASVPLVLIEKWLREDGIDVFDKNHDKRVFQKINSPEYRYLKTTTKTHMAR
jgi:hypothetical protein